MVCHYDILVTFISVHRLLRDQKDSQEGTGYLSSIHEVVESFLITH